MARILFATVPIVGHITPLLGVARALVLRGHEVHWYTGAKYAAKISATGAHHRPYLAARDFDDLGLDAAFPGRAQHSGLAQLRFDMKHVFADPALDQLADLSALVGELEPRVLVADPGMLGALFVRERLGVPLFMVSVVPNPLPSRDLAPFGLGLSPMAGALGRARNALLHGLTRELLFRDVNAHWREVRKRAGLGAEVGLFEALGHADLVGLPTVPGFEYPRSDLPAHVRFLGLLPGARPSATPAPLADLDPLLPVVHVTQGTVANAAPDLIAPAIAGLAREPVQVLVATGGRSAAELGLTDLPANVRVAHFYDYAELLPRCSAMVTNGGYGGVQLALSAGVPLVVAGETEDKPEVAARVAYAGVGVRLKRQRPAAEEVRRAVRAVLDDSAYRLRAQALAAEYARYDGVAEALRAVEELAGRATLLPARAVRASRPAPTLEARSG